MSETPFVGCCWTVLADPPPLGEGVGHKLTVDLDPDPDRKGWYIITCDHHCPTRCGEYKAADSDGPERIVGADFVIVRGIQCRPSEGSNTGSWTAEDQSGPHW